MVVLSRQRELDVDPKAIQQIELVRLKFSQRSVTVL